MKYLIWIAAVALFLSPQSAMAQDVAGFEDLEPIAAEGHFRSEGDRGNRIARSGFALLKISASARLAGMADANVGTSRDIHAIFQNAAGWCISTIWRIWRLITSGWWAPKWALVVLLSHSHRRCGCLFSHVYLSRCGRDNAYATRWHGSQYQLGDFSVAASFAKATDR